jgi:hypothetical protein
MSASQANSTTAATTLVKAPVTPTSSIAGKENHPSVGKITQGDIDAALALFEKQKDSIEFATNVGPM